MDSGIQVKKAIPQNRRGLGLYLLDAVVITTDSENYCTEPPETA